MTTIGRTKNAIGFGRQAQMVKAAQLALAPIAPPDNLVTVKEAAEFLRLTPKALYARVARGQMPCIRLGRYKRSAIRFTRVMLVDSLCHESSTITTERAA